MRKQSAGYTIIELVIVIAFVAAALVAFVGFGLIGAGNYWYTEGGVLKELRIEHPNVTEIVKTERNILSDSVITTKEDGTLHSYCLNSNVLFNYTFSDCK